LHKLPVSFILTTEMTTRSNKMIYEHSIDIDSVEKSLIKAILQASEEGEHESIYVQKYTYNNELWSFSFYDKNCGIKVLPKEVEKEFIEKFKNYEYKRRCQYAEKQRYHVFLFL
ncbi:MAG: hypothetical protein ACPG7E_09455, partial [Marinirhabdus sp.]